MRVIVTGAGGFILPNDRVDVLLTRRLKNPDQSSGAPDVITSEIILANKSEQDADKNKHPALVRQKLLASGISPGYRLVP